MQAFHPEWHTLDPAEATAHRPFDSAADKAWKIINAMDDPAP
jgi:hypothetical protein